MRTFLLILLSAIIVLLVGQVQGQTRLPDIVEPKVFVAPMENGFDAFVTAALVREKVPVVIVTDEALADYIITGVAVKGSNKWYDTFFDKGKDRNQGSITVLYRAEKTVAWAGAAGDRSFWFASIKKTGFQKVAGRLAHRMRLELFNGVKKSP